VARANICLKTATEAYMFAASSLICLEHIAQNLLLEARSNIGA
jgi:hypothetical protein